MPQTARHLIEALFVSEGRPVQPVNFEWRLIRRKGQPFLLLPPDLTGARMGLKLYSAQRPLAKICCTLLPVLLQTPAVNLFKPIRLQVDAASEIMQFMAQQADLPANELFSVAIKLSKESRGAHLVLLLCDESNRPIRIIKVGFNGISREVINHEADLLAKFPSHMLGCSHLTGRIARPTFSAFATDYFPGVSPADDAGMERLFHAWLNSGSPVPLVSLPLWQELIAVEKADQPNWSQLIQLLADKTIRTTLYHGDFAPWNVRVVNSQNLQVFDWEYGSLRGIPGWDWFHFTIQTSILARRYSTERVAAEVEQLIGSSRFEKYANAAGLTGIVRPLVLAYLFHQRDVIKPFEGGHTTADLLEFLSVRWQFNTELVDVSSRDQSALRPRPNILRSIQSQWQLVFAQLSNLYWEPSLNSSVQPSWFAQLQTQWRVILIAAGLLSAVAITQFLSAPHLIFLPFYIAISAMVTLKMGRRWGVLVAANATVLSAAVSLKNFSHQQSDVLLWNSVMRFFIIGLCVLFVDRIHKQKGFFRRWSAVSANQPVKLADTWAVILLSGGLLFGAVLLDLFTDPTMVVLPLYLLPCMLLTLVSNLSWGIVTIVIVNLIASSLEYLGGRTDDYTVVQVFGWNFVMRLAIFLLVIVLLDRIRREDILFFQSKVRRR